MDSVARNHLAPALPGIANRSLRFTPAEKRIPIRLLQIGTHRNEMCNADCLSGRVLVRWRAAMRAAYRGSHRAR